MFKFLVVSVLLCHEIHEITGGATVKPILADCSEESLLCYNGKSVGPGYFVLNNVGATKVHEDKVMWNTARHNCVKEGGHLAVIRTIEDLEVIKILLLQNSIGRAWVGYHDIFQEGHWITVLDESLSAMNVNLWLNLHNSTDENCGLFVTISDGLIDENCKKTYPYVCQLNI